MSSQSQRGSQAGHPSPDVVASSWFSRLAGGGVPERHKRNIEGVSAKTFSERLRKLPPKVVYAFIEKAKHVKIECKRILATAGR